MLKPEQQTVLNMITARIRGTKFATTKQAIAMRDGIVKELDKIAMDLANKKQVASNKAARDKAEKVAYRAPFRKAWCERYLTVDAAIRITGIRVWVVVRLMDNEFAVVSDGKVEKEIDFDKIEKVLIDGKWKDTYELAAKGC